MKYLVSLVVVLGLFACGDDDVGPADSMPDAVGGCTVDSDCDDGVFCNGAEVCAGGACMSGTGDVCPVGTSCDEELQACASNCGPRDADGDGAISKECGGTDCDDNDPSRFPGNTEICDPLNVDEDCDPNTFGFRDADQDQNADVACCNLKEDGSMNCGTDCDDQRPGTNPDVPEVCDERDNDCDGSVDEGVMISLYADADSDSYGNNEVAITTCLTGEQEIDGVTYVLDNRDCNDEDGTINPGQSELCTTEDVDENCDGKVDEEELGTCVCDLGESQDCTTSVLGACLGSTQTCIESNNVAQWSECSILPAPRETCVAGTVGTNNAIDEDCDGMVDETVSALCYADLDGDGLALRNAVGVLTCLEDDGSCPVGSTLVAPLTRENTDCDENNAQLTFRTCRPDTDRDGYPAETAPTAEVECDEPCADGWTDKEEWDCCDTDRFVHPNRETFRLSPGGCGVGFDLDCDGVVEKRHPNLSVECPQGADSMSCTDQHDEANVQWTGSVVPECGEEAPIGRGCYYGREQGGNTFGCFEKWFVAPTTRVQRCK